MNPGPANLSNQHFPQGQQAPLRFYPMPVPTPFYGDTNVDQVDIQDFIKFYLPDDPILLRVGYR